MKPSNKNRLSTLFSFWNQGELRRTDWVCLESWVALGHQVKIYSFSKSLRLPDGVELLDASQVLCSEWMQQIAPIIQIQNIEWQPVVNFSDLFRMKGLIEGLGVWLDTDVYLLKSINICSDQPFLFWEGYRRIGSPVIYLPQNSPMLREYMQIFDNIETIPSWVEFRKRFIRPLKWTLRGMRFRPSDLGITIYGNYAFTRLGRKYYSRDEIGAKNVFFHWIANETRRFYTDALGFSNLTAVDALGIHVHRKDLDQVDPVKGSIFETALRKSKYGNQTI